MNILWITLESILPANSGGRIGVYKRLERIAKKNAIFLYYPYDNEDEAIYLAELEKICHEVHIYKRNRLGKTGINLIKYPYTVASRKILQMRKDIEKCILDKNIDIINVDFPHMCVNLLGIETHIPIIINEHNIEWKVYQTISKSQKSLLKKVAYYIDAYRLKYYEQNLMKRMRFSKVTFVSEKDMEYMIDSKLINEKQAELVPVGADIHEPLCFEKHNGKNIIFVGKMSYGPNIEAAKWFVKEVFPRLREMIEDVKFYIVGKDPSDDIKRMESEDIIVTGLVDNVKKFYTISDLVVIPLKNGGGVKVKLLEAISYNKPIVSTSIGVEGTYYSNHYIPVADDADIFADYCMHCLTDQRYYEKEKIYNYFIENYTWAEIGNKYNDIMQKVISGE